MDKTPKISKSLNRRNFYTGAANKVNGSDTEFVSCSTPVTDTKMFVEMENDDSPVHIACTQEGCDNVDVVWDWNSPQARQRPKRIKKRLILPQSPKIPLKRHPSNNQIQNFEKLREELQSLREAMSIPDNEESLLLSPLEEAEYKDVNNDQTTNDVPPLTQENCLGVNNEDLFNDLADEQLLLCTQKIEADLEAARKNINESNKNLINNSASKDTKSVQDIRDIRNTCINNQNLPSTNHFNSATDDSFDKVLGKINVADLENSTVIDKQISHPQGIKRLTHLSFGRTRSENNYNRQQVGKVEFHRTHSFESTVEYAKEMIPQHKLDEIQRKRKEALAKLESKKKQEYNNSLSKCSAEEIEQKRLQALAKLEVKRQQEIIERKRQEALKRLELSRKKNATIVKSSLSKRL